MADRLIFTYTRVDDYNQLQEDALALTLVGQPYGTRVIFNTDLEVARVWNGTVFINSPETGLSKEVTQQDIATKVETLRVSQENKLDIVATKVEEAKVATELVATKVEEAKVATELVATKVEEAKVATELVATKLEDSTKSIIDVNNSTTTILLAGATYMGSATDITKYPQVNLSVYGRPSAILGDGLSAKGSLFIEFSKNGTLWTISIPVLVRDGGLLIPLPLIKVEQFYRIRYINDGGVSAITLLGLMDVPGTPTLQTAFVLTSYLLPLASKEIIRTIDQTISGSDPVVLVRSVLAGRTLMGNFGSLDARKTAPTGVEKGLIVRNIPSGVQVVSAPSNSFYHNNNVNETRNVKTGAGKLKRIVFNGPALGTVTLYNSLAGSGVIIAILSVAGSLPFQLDYDIAFTIGLTYVSASNVGSFTLIFE